MLNDIKASIADSVSVKSAIMKDDALLKGILKAAESMIVAFKSDKKILFCGNGGSAADAQHLSAELSGRFKIDRNPLDAEALHVNTSYLTAVANDYSYEEIFSRLVKAKGKKGDILVGLSTSGNSRNVLRAFEEAGKKGMYTIALTGQKENLLESVANITIKIPSDDTARIQECHIMIGHILCELVEKSLFDETPI